MTLIGQTAFRHRCFGYLLKEKLGGQGDLFLLATFCSMLEDKFVVPIISYDKILDFILVGRLLQGLSFSFCLQVLC